MILLATKNFSVFSSIFNVSNFRIKTSFFALVLIVGVIIAKVVVTCANFFMEFTHGYHMLGDETVLLF